MTFIKLLPKLATKKNNFFISMIISLENIYLNESAVRLIRENFQ